MPLSKIACSNCGEENERNRSKCSECNTSFFVNVNIYSDPYFREGLDERYNQAKKEFDQKGKIDEIAIFENAVMADGKAVINMDSKLFNILVSQNEDYLPYQRAVEQGKRLIAAFRNDGSRCMVEGAFYGMHGRDIVYAALTLNGEGISSYGDVSIVLKTKNIRARTTVFERNTYFLFDDLTSKGWLPTKTEEEIPTGHFGIWEDRGKIAVVKHGTAIADGSAKDLATLILWSEGDRHTDEFIELHLFGEVNQRQFEAVTFLNKPKGPFKKIQRKLMTHLTANSIEIRQK